MWLQTCGVPVLGEDRFGNDRFPADPWDRCGEPRFFLPFLPLPLEQNSPPTLVVAQRVPKEFCRRFSFMVLCRESVRTVG